MSDIQDVDVLIIGGGINGCGTYRDLCAQGVDCLLLERDDFCGGASGGSSRLIHGGLKYLESGEFRLVRESVIERNRLLNNAPHYVFALPSIVPLRSRFGGIWTSIQRFLGRDAKMTDRGSLITRLGLVIYDAFSRRISALPGHRMLARQRLDQHVRGLDHGVRYGALYYEGRITHAERLGFELLLDGEDLNPNSTAENHVDQLEIAGDVVRYRCRGQTHAVRPRVIVNAGGAWIDHVNAALGIDSQLMGGSKGAHLVVDHPALHKALNGHMVYFGTADGRVNLVYPFVNDRVLVGATDIPIEDPDSAACDDDERGYLKQVVTEVFPDLRITDEQIRYTFSGVRPLPRADGEIGNVTRDHSLVEKTAPGGVPVLCLIGGKWTTFRQFSAEVTDHILARIGRSRTVATDDMAIGGGQNYPSSGERADWVARHAEQSGLAPERVERLLARYGTRCVPMLAELPGETPLATLPDYSQEEIDYLTAHERVQTVDDLLRRRTPIAIGGRLTPAVADEIAHHVDRFRASDDAPAHA